MTNFGKFLSLRKVSGAKTKEEGGEIIKERTPYYPLSRGGDGESEGSYALCLALCALINDKEVYHVFY